MPIPTQDDFQQPLLNYLNTQSGPVPNEIVHEALADQFRLTSEERDQRNPHGCPTYKNNIAWAYVNLQRKDLCIRMNKAKEYRLSTKGKILPTLTLILALCFICAAQTPKIEYGSAADLKGITKIFVDTGTDMEVRESILKEISKSSKKIPGLVVVSRPEDAEVILTFGATSNSYLAGINTSPTYSGTSSSPVYRTVVNGDGLVVKPLGDNRVRLIMSFKDSRTSRWERRPSTNFAREFVHAYMDANGIKR